MVQEKNGTNSDEDTLPLTNDKGTSNKMMAVRVGRQLVAFWLKHGWVMIAGVIFGMALQHSLSATLQNNGRSKTTIQELKSNGWNMVHVFYGKNTYIADTLQHPVKDAHERRWTGQAKQDELVFGLLGNKHHGYFVDLAAYDAIYVSNTYALEQFYGWNGLCIEANPIHWESLAYRKCNVVAAVVGGTTMEEVTFNSVRGFGGIVGKEFDNKRGGPKPRTMFTVTIQDIFARFHTPHIIDYLSLDVEGAEYLVMQDFPFDSYRFRLLTIERPNDALKKLLAQQGYVLLKTIGTWGETLWAYEKEIKSLDQEALKKLETFEPVVG